MGEKAEYSGLEGGEADLRTWHLNNQDIPSTQYSKRKQVELYRVCVYLSGSVMGAGAGHPVCYAGMLAERLGDWVHQSCHPQVGKAPHLT